MVAALTIFLWLCCQCLAVRLDCQTLWGQQHETLLAYLQYKQGCCLCVALVEEQRQQAADVQVKALADEADERLRQDALANKQCCLEANKRRLQPTGCAGQQTMLPQGSCMRCGVHRIGAC